MRSARLRPVPDVPLRALALIRVSKERDGMVSPELQDTAIGDYCARAGYQVIERMEGLDESGSGARSRWWAKLDAAVGMVEAGQVDVIVVWKFSRTARHRLRWAVALDRVETAGGRLESATEQVDVSTSTGRFTRGMLAELNAFEAERIGEVWKETQARRRALGLPHSGGYRPGYIYEDKQYRPDPETAPLVAEAYRRYVDGAGTLKLAEWMRAVGIPCRVSGAQWTYRGAQRALDSGFAAGLLHVHDPACGCPNRGGACERRVHIQGAHEPIISKQLWTAYLGERARRLVTPRRLLAPSTPLAGLVRCAACGYGMRLKNGPLGRAKIYACAHRRGCPRPTTVVVSRAEAAAKEWLVGYAHDVDAQTALLSSRAASQAAARSAVTRLARGVGQLQGELTSLSREYARGVIPEAAYTAARDELLVELAAAEAALAESSARLAPRRPSPKVAADLLAGWDLYDVADCNRICRDLLRVVAARGERNSVLEVVPAWEWRPPPRG